MLSLASVRVRSSYVPPASPSTAYVALVSGLAAIVARVSGLRPVWSASAPTLHGDRSLPVAAVTAVSAVSAVSGLAVVACALQSPSAS